MMPVSRWLFVHVAMGGGYLIVRKYVLWVRVQITNLEGHHDLKASAQGYCPCYILKNAVKLRGTKAKPKGPEAEVMTSM